MNKNYKELLKTACLTRTKMFIDQEFDYFELVKNHSDLLDDLKNLNEIVFELFQNYSWSEFENEWLSLQGQAENSLNLDFKMYLKSELLTCFWGNVQYGDQFKYPIQNNLNLNSSQKFHLRFGYVFLQIRKNAESFNLYISVRKLASYYDLASLAFRMLLKREKYLLSTFLKLSIGLETLEYRSDNLQDYYLWIYSLSPSDTLKRGTNSVSFKPIQNLSFDTLNGRDKKNQLIQIQEAILSFQITIGKSYSFYEVLFLNLNALHQVLHKNVAPHLVSCINELEEILDFLSERLRQKKNSTPKEKSVDVEYKALILQYFCLFKKHSYCSGGISEPNGFNKFLYRALKSEKLVTTNKVKFTPTIYTDGLEQIDVECKNVFKMCFSYGAIQARLKRRRKINIPIQIVEPELLDPELSTAIDLNAISKIVADQPWVERSFSE